MLCTTGNKVTQSITFMHWNKGKSYFHNKLNDLYFLIDKHHPNIVSLSEANVDRTIDQIDYHLDGFNIETTDMKANLNISRSALLVDKRLAYIRRHDLERQYISAIWIEVKLGKKKTVLASSAYRQWQLPKLLGFTNTFNPKQQLLRYKSMIDCWSLALAENKDTVVLTDDNLNTLQNSDHNSKYRLTKLQELRDQHLTQHGLTIHNNKPTFFDNQSSSCIDHIYSNCPSHFHNTTTIKSGLSDHCVLLINYSTKKSIISANYAFKRNKHLLTKHSLCKYFENNYNLNTIFNSTDANIVAVYGYIKCSYDALCCNDWEGCNECDDCDG